MKPKPFGILVKHRFLFMGNENGRTGWYQSSLQQCRVRRLRQRIKKYYAPEAGIVIGRSNNPVNQTGGRILHLGIS